MDQNERKKVGIPTLKRLPLYLRLLRQMKDDGRDYASGTVVAKKLSLDPIVVRKDLAITGAVGRPRLGFQMDEIIEAIEDFLGWTNTSEAFLVGVGNLGRALLRHKGFEQHGLKIISGFDSKVCFTALYWFSRFLCSSIAANSRSGGWYPYIAIRYQN